MRRTQGRLFKRGGVYLVRWQYDGKDYRKSTGFRNLRKATAAAETILAPFRQKTKVEALAQLQSRVDREAVVMAGIDDATNPPLSIAQAWSAYVESPERPDSGPATLRQYEAEYWRFRKWAEKEHPDLKAMRSVSRELANLYAMHLTGEGATPSTFNQHVGFLRLMWRVLAEKGRIIDNPWGTVKRKRLNGHGRRELTIAELRKVSAAATGDLRILLALGIYTGMRFGDCATLRWCEADVARGVITRVPMKTARRSGKPMTIPMHPALRAMLAETPEANRTGFVLPGTAEQYAKDRSVVKELVQDHFKECEIETTRETGAPRQRALVSVGFHSLRHSFVSLCRESGAPLSVVESIVGHSNPAMTRHYTHTSEAAACSAVNALPYMTGEPVKALPAADPLATFKAQVRAIVEGLNGKTWKAAKEQLTVLVQ